MTQLMDPRCANIPFRLLVSLLIISEMRMAQPASINREGRMRGYSKSTLRDYEGICGKSRESFASGGAPVATFRILNGTCAKYGDYPWVAQIQIRRNDKHEQHCGGTIISDDLILTAAHCFQNLRPSFMRVVVGQYDLEKVDKAELVFDIEEVTIHDDWDSPYEGRYSNDIAIVRLRRKGDGSAIRFGPNVAPACLPKPEMDFLPGMDCVIAGWGKTESHGEVHEKCLRSALVPIIEQDICIRMYSKSDKRITQGMICAGYEDGGVDTCKGDSGGPLACKIDGSYHIFGIVSWGEGCGKRNRPGVYTNVQRYTQWIKANSN